MQNKKRREELFLLLCLAAAGVCAVLAFRFAVPLQAQTPQTLPDTKELAAYTQGELMQTLCAPCPVSAPTMHRPFWTTGRSTARLHRWRMRHRCRALPKQWWIHGQGKRMSARVYLKKGTARLLPWSKRKYGDLLL